MIAWNDVNSFTPIPVLIPVDTIMPRRSAPFVLPDNLDHLMQVHLDASSNADDIEVLTKLSNTPKKAGKMLLSSLQADIASFRDDQFPPPILTQLRDMPIYYGNLDEVQAYHALWQPLIDRAMQFYPSAYLPPDHLPLPASLEIPQFVFNVQRIHLTKTRAKESKSFGSGGALIAKCGEFSDAQTKRLEDVLRRDETAQLVAHRAFIDLRAYVFCKDSKGKLLDPERMRFYRTGLIVHALPDFKIVDSRQKPRKRRNDAYTNPLADNGVWKVFLKR